MATGPDRLGRLMQPVILYLHGFCSSPDSWKARHLADSLAARGQAEQYYCPALSHVPFEAIAQAGMRFQLATGQLQNTAALKQCKKDIARVKTVIRQLEMSGKA